MCKSKLLPIIILILLLINLIVLSSKENVNYQKILQKYINYKTTICLIKIERDTIIRIETSGCRGPAKLFICKIIKMYKDDNFLDSTYVNVIYLPINTKEADFLPEKIENDLVNEIIFDKEIIMTFGFSESSKMFITNDDSPCYYIFKEPGKTLFKYLEKKYGKKPKRNQKKHAIPIQQKDK